MTGQTPFERDRWEALLLDHAAHFYRNGWVVGTSGNLSVRLPGEEIRITASGGHKGSLSREDLLTVDGDGRVLSDIPARPSAELSLHLAIYRHVAEAGAVYHVHTIESNLVSMWAANGELPLPPLEMLKGFGIPGHAAPPSLPVFDNDPDVSRIALQVEDLFRRKEGAMVPGFLIHLHGLTVWGKTPEEALKHVELFDFLFRFQVQSRSMEGR